MQKYKNVELAKMYKVSEKSIRNWIDAAKSKKLNLEIIAEGSREYIINTPNNHSILKNLSQKGKKFKNTKSLKLISPKSQFYDIFSKKQIIEIINCIETYREIPMKYTYFNQGAHIWDEYVNTLLNENVSAKIGNYAKDTIHLMDLSLDYISSVIEEYNFVNVVDIGVGNGAPVKNLLTKLISKGKLRKYIGIDYSQEMLEVAHTNLKEWFGDDFPFEAHIKDINYDRFQDILYENSHFGRENNSCINIVLFVGGTAGNEMHHNLPINIIKDSMGKSDIFILGQRLDTDYAKVSLAFYSSNTRPKSNVFEATLGLDAKEKWIPDILNLSEDLYEVVKLYDERSRSRFCYIVMKKDIDLVFDADGIFQKVSLVKDDKIIVWRSRHQSYEEIVQELSGTGFNIFHTSTSMNSERTIFMARTKRPA
jgi:uncharacterized SAM-dependent methyltransferase